MVIPAKETFEGAQLDLTDSPLHTIQWARVILDEADELRHVATRCGRTGATAVVTPRGATECLGPRLDPFRISVVVY